MDSPISADYIITGAGALGMGFADTILSETNSTVAMIDAYEKPGGHWLNAYSFVRLHQPSSFYGVASLNLGSSEIDTSGSNKGLFELATAHEIIDYYDQVMRKRFIPTGRFQYYPMSRFEDDRSVTSLVNGSVRETIAKRYVDARYLQPSVPATRKPAYVVDASVEIMPINGLTRLQKTYPRYVVVGAGKTGIDACMWLLEHGADPNNILWIMPRDYWFWNRARIQPGEEFLPGLLQLLADEVELISKSDSADEMFVNLEACGNVLRVDAGIQPKAFHGGTISVGELEAIRHIKNIVRLGRVTSIEARSIRLEGGDIPADNGWLYIDCTASAISRLKPKPIFASDLITLLPVRIYQPIFSAAFVAHVEAKYADDEKKNELCVPIMSSDTTEQWVKAMGLEITSRARWAAEPGLMEWCAGSRLDLLTPQLATVDKDNKLISQHLERLERYSPAALTRIRSL